MQNPFNLQVNMLWWYFISNLYHQVKFGFIKYNTQILDQNIK